MASQEDRELEYQIGLRRNQVGAQAVEAQVDARQRESTGSGLASVPLGKLKDGLGAAEAALNIAQDTLIAAADRQAKLDAINGEVQTADASELVLRYPALEA